MEYTASNPGETTVLREPKTAIRVCTIALVACSDVVVSPFRVREFQEHVLRPGRAYNLERPHRVRRLSIEIVANLAVDMFHLFARAQP